MSKRKCRMGKSNGKGGVGVFARRRRYSGAPPHEAKSKRTYTKGTTDLRTIQRPPLFVPFQ